MRLIAMALSVAFLAPDPLLAGELEEAHRQALRAYDRAMEHYGVALGERPEDGSAVRKQIGAQVAELVCLRGGKEACLQASAVAERTLGPYLEPLAPAEAPAPQRWARAQAFLVQACRLSEGHGLDAAVASEALGLLAQIEGDHQRAQAGKHGRARRAAALARARTSGASPRALEDWLEVQRLSRLMLDLSGQVEAAEGLAAAVLAMEAGRLTAGEDAARFSAALEAGLDGLHVLGRAAPATLERLERAMARLQTRGLAVPDLQFGSLPPAESFEVDLALAAEELRALAGRAPLRSRPSVLLTFFAAYAGILSGLPDAAESLGNLREVLALTDPYLGSRVAGLLGRAALWQGDFHRAAGLLREAALGLEHLPGGVLLAGLAQASEAQALFFLGKYPQAAEAFAAAAPRLAQQPASALQAYLGQGHALTFAGRLEAAAGPLARAEALLARVRPEERGGLSRAVRLGRALWELTSGRKDAASAILREVAEEARQAGDVRAGATARVNLAELLNDGGGHAQALVEAEAALAWLDAGSQADTAWQAWTEKGRALAGLERAEAAQRALDRAMDLVEGLRARIGSEGARRTFSAGKTRLYRAAVALAVDRGQADQAFLAAERARGRAFLDMLAERPVKLGDPARQARLGPARARLLGSLPRPALGFEEPIAGLAGSASTGPGQPPRPDPRSDWLGLASVNPAGVEDVRRVLRRDEALLAFFHDGSRLLTFLVSRAGVELRSTPLDEETLRNRVASLQRLLGDPHSDEAAIRDKGARLAELLLADLRGRLAAFGRLSVVPFGPLHFLPLGALWDGQAYLVDRFELASLPSASSLVMLRSRAGPAAVAARARVLALGNPTSELPGLPAAEREVALVGSLWREAELGLGEQATKQRFLERAPGSALIHLGSHGVFLPERPMDSYLALAGASPEEGRLSALEVLGVDLRPARLVTLSACSSAEVQVEHGDELMGFSRAFLHAGAPALVASLWPVDDEAALALVGKLYTGLRAGQPPIAALSAAARAVKAEARHAHPFFWASLAFIGS